ncbi:MAG TPA: Gfo/Idh/MocA family oxidoreductase [Acidobacteriota bacterium]|nr:Gfo/Idh/MocA family oxidoreductase [Acidobacteriota bacterium]HRR26485.1 Gfo/Idh/MocA family oxidoreductase [Acidobacteriota bacterium]HRV07190.1 Gfo/Idh/MocA family oxidoreductase [Acidobacteriota bacterium]
MSERKLNVGLVGGGGGAFIVHPHQRAIHMDGTRQVVCGALHPDPEVAMREAEAWPYPIRGYRNFREMIENESRLPVGERMDYVLIVTPNHVHFEPAKLALEAGFPVFCEKPLTVTLEESDELVRIVKAKNIPFCVAHTYLGHWTSRLSRHIVRSGLLGKIRWVDSHYIQGWLASRAEEQGSLQAEWRVDPKRAGISGCGGDIGTHALMQLRYVTGLEVHRLKAFLETFVEGRRLDDHFTAYCELSNGGKALIRCSQITIGHKNDLGIEVAGENGTLVWNQEEPECLRVYLSGQPDRVYWRGEVKPHDGFLGDVPPELLQEPTTPSGHPEGFHDAFGRLHRCFEADVRAYQRGEYRGADGSRYATVEDGRTGIAFLVAAVESNRRNHEWVTLP